MVNLLKSSVFQEVGTSTLFSIVTGFLVSLFCLPVQFSRVNNMIVVRSLICLGGITHNVSICVRAGLPKPRAVPDSERNKDTKTLDYASTPLDANTLLWPVCNRIRKPSA
jgi:hypothetical protein